jgi:hypothetical protein
MYFLDIFLVSYFQIERFLADWPGAVVILHLARWMDMDPPACRSREPDCQTEKDSAGHPCAHDMMIERSRIDQLLNHAG